MAVDTTDLTEANGWIPEPSSNEVLTKASDTSAVEAVGRKIRMTAPTVTIPRFESEGADIVAEAATIPVQTADLDEVDMRAVKFANRFAISIEDQRDAVVDVLNAKKAAWISAFSRKFDNAALGVTAAKNGGTVPYESVYHLANAASRVTATAGLLTYEDLVDTFGELESGDYSGELVVIAHPSFAMDLRNLKDSAGDRVVAVSEVLGAQVPTIFGHRLVFSKGARTSATATDRPTGNPLLVAGYREHLIVGVLDGPESQVSDQPRWATDEVELKLRARRGFVAATAEAFQVIEKTAATP